MSDLAFHIREFVPDCAEGEEMELRCGLLRARSYAVELITRVGAPVSVDLAITARDTADIFVFADQSLDRLKMALHLCRHLVQAAKIMEHFERECGE